MLDDEGMQLEDERSAEPQEPAAHRHVATRACASAVRTGVDHVLREGNARTSAAQDTSSGVLLKYC